MNATFKGIQRWDRVRFRCPNGCKLVAGKIVPEFKVCSALVNHLLLFADHVVVDYGPFGQVVNEENYLGHTSTTWPAPWPAGRRRNPTTNRDTT